MRLVSNSSNLLATPRHSPLDNNRSGRTIVIICAYIIKTASVLIQREDDETLHFVDEFE